MLALLVVAGLGLLAYNKLRHAPKAKAAAAPVYTPVQLAVAKWNGKKVKVPANMIFWGATDPEKDLVSDAANGALIEGTISGTGQYHALAHDVDFVAIDLDVSKLNADMAAAMPTAGQSGRGWLVKKPETIQTATPSA